MNRQYSPFDQLIIGLDRAVSTVFGRPATSRENPAFGKVAQLTTEDQRLSAGLMRVNHAGEVAAQALYQGQALTARSDFVKERMRQAAQEENDHLAWCATRIKELDSRVSLLDPIWYAGSFALGAIAGAAGDKWSLGFVAETEHQVCLHLEEHLEKLPAEDAPSRAILAQMKLDEIHHGEQARQAGAAELPAMAKKLMTLASKVMTKTAYRF